MCAEIVPGGIFSNYELPDHTSNLRKLSDLQGEDPVIPTLARGHYCTKNISSIWSSPRSIRRSLGVQSDRDDCH